MTVSDATSSSDLNAAGSGQGGPQLLGNAINRNGEQDYVENASDWMQGALSVDWGTGALPSIRTGSFSFVAASSAATVDTVTVTADPLAQRALEYSGGKDWVTAELRAGQNANSMSETGWNFLKGVEQLRLTPYDDQTKKPISSYVKGATIGYGHLIQPNEWSLYSGGITGEQAESLLNQDMKPAQDAVRNLVKVSLSSNQFDALTMLAFNIGTGDKGFAGSSVLKLVNDPSAVTPYNSLDSAWADWNISQGKVNQGLINRRAAEINIYNNGVYNHW